MKIFSGIAIGMLAASIIVGYSSNELTAGALIFRISLIAVNIACCAMWDGR